MRMAFDVILALLASYGIIALVWLLLGVFGRQKAMSVYALIDADEMDEKILKHTLASIDWLQQWGILQLHPVIASSKYDDKLSELATRHGGFLCKTPSNKLQPSELETTFFSEVEAVMTNTSKAK